MQYILSQQELDELRLQQRSIRLSNTTRIKKLCETIANEMPITRSWAKNSPPSPWGCRHTKGGINEGGYCDDCPVKEICPAEQHYSQ